MIAPLDIIVQHSPSAALADLRTLASPYPGAIYDDTRELALRLGYSEFAVEEARRWMLEDSLEVRA